MFDKLKLFLKEYDVYFMVLLLIPPLIFSIIISPFFPEPDLWVYLVNYFLGIALIIVLGGAFAQSKV